MWGDEDSDGGEHKPANGGDRPRQSREARGHPAASRKSYDQYEDVLDRVADQQRIAEGIRQGRKHGLVRDPISALDFLTSELRLLTAPLALLKSLAKSAARRTVVHAVKKTGSKGPGTWVEVARGRHGLEHQSNMSGQPIREAGGKLYIKEYEVNGVKFDDYKNGKLYEYKGSHGKLLNKEKEFHDWVEGAKKLREDALRQTGAARGVPVVWRVGAEQVKAFRKAVGDVPGLEIVP